MQNLRKKLITFVNNIGLMIKSLQNRISESIKFLDWRIKKFMVYVNTRCAKSSLWGIIFLHLNLLYWNIVLSFLDLKHYLELSFLNLKFQILRCLNYLFSILTWIKEHPKYFFYVHTFQLILLLIALFLFYMHFDMFFFEFHLLLLIGRGVFIGISLLLRTKYKNYILCFFYFHLGASINEKRFTREDKEKIEFLFIRIWGNVFFLYVLYSNRCHIMLCLLWIYIKLRLLN